MNVSNDEIKKTESKNKRVSFMAMGALLDAAACNLMLTKCKYNLCTGEKRLKENNEALLQTNQTCMNVKRDVMLIINIIARPALLDDAMVFIHCSLAITTFTSY